ncbi:MAG: hypothetical protein GXP13_10055 [Gammaproteobacteria bacterium]|nr:hypothetical protein [Gammaproteobacteria bacterium]
MKSITYIYKLIVIAFVITACSSGTKTAQQASTSIFYPPLPNKPRIQYLLTINAGSIQRSKRTEFSDFVLGKDEVDNSRINKPYGVAFDGNEFLVVDTRGPGYMVLSSDDKLIKTVKGSGGGRMVKPINITLDDKGNRYVTDTGRNQVLLYDKNDGFVRAYGIKKQFKPADVLIDGTDLYISDLLNHEIHVLDQKTGKTLSKISSVGSKKDEVFFPTNLALDPNGNLLISDTGNYRVQLFNTNGNYIRSYGHAGSGLGQFARPKGIAVDRDGQIYVVDSAFENVQVFASDGELLLYFGKPGNDVDSLNLPADITIQYAGVEKFQKYADKNFTLEYLIMVSNQFGPNKIGVFGYGRYGNEDGGPIVKK